MTQDLTHKELANQAYALVRQNAVPLTNWGFYLVDPAFDGEQELRNKIGAVWLGSLYDSIGQEDRLVPGLRERANDLGLDHLNDVLDLAEALIHVTKEVLALYSIEEKIFILDFRNQLVHGWLTNSHRRNVHVKYFDSGSIRAEHIAQERYAAIIRQFAEAGWDNALQELIERFRTQPLRYWNAVEQINDRTNDAKLRRIVYAGLDGNPPLRPGEYTLNVRV